MISSEQSTDVLGCVKIVMLWPSGKTDVRVPDQKGNIALVKNIALKNSQVIPINVILSIRNCGKMF